MHAAGKALTVLLALLLTLGLPISAGRCRAEVPGCCCASENCRCHLSTPVTQLPQPTNSAVAPSTKAAHDAAMVSASVGAAAVAIILSGTFAGVPVPLALDGPPLYVRSHAFLI